MMLWIHPEDAPKGPDDYCKFVCAELPDPVADPVAHEMVKKHMIHGPCDSLGEKNPPINPDARCLTKGLTNKKCEKNYPKPFAKSYSTGATMNLFIKDGPQMMEALLENSTSKISKKLLKLITVLSSHIIESSF